MFKKRKINNRDMYKLNYVSVNVLKFLNVNNLACFSEGLPENFDKCGQLDTV